MSLPSLVVTRLRARMDLAGALFTSRSACSAAGSASPSCAILARPVGQLLASSSFSTTTSPSSDLPPSTSSRPSNPSTVSTTQETVEQVRYPYFVRRSRYGQLPVYSEYKGGGNKTVTIIRKVEGDIQALKADLLSAIDPEPSSPRSLPTSKSPRDARIRKAASPVHIMPTSRNVVVDGNVVKAIKEWLALRGF